MKLTWTACFPVGLLVLSLLSLIAGLVTPETGRTILQIAVVVLVVSWMAIRVVSRWMR